MSWHYRCPECKVLLNPDETIILAAAREGTEHKVLVGLSGQPGDYSVFFPPDVETVKGEAWSFYCPICHADLAVKGDDKLCAVERHDDDGHDTQVVFSRITGQQATFVIKSGQLVEEHGMDLKEFLYYTSIFR